MDDATAEALAERSARRMEARLGKEEGYVPEVVRNAGQVDLPDDELEDDDTATDAPAPKNTDQPAGEDRYGREIDELKQQLASMNGRVAPMQRDLATYQALVTEQQRELDAAKRTHQAEIERLQKELEARQVPVNPLELLDEQDRELLDGDVLNVVAKLTQKLVQASAPKVDVRTEVARYVAERDAAEIKSYREQALLSRDLSDIVELRNDPKFNDWASQDDNEIESTVTMFLNASDKGSIDKYARILKSKLNRFRESTKPSPSAKTPASDADTRLAAGMRRKQNGTQSRAEIEAQLAEAKRLARSRLAADREKANQILTALGG